jgi:2-polyprenyl-3-methyl-5-hydroxy-6-metoxy-1,4-benzoquinol methylase
MRNLYTDLAEYTKRPQVLVEARSIHASVETAWQFEQYKDKPLEHYRNTDLYTFASTRYQMELQANNMHEWYQSAIKTFKWKNGLDLGGGIGEQTILAIEAGVEKMTFVEVGNSPTEAYAKWRFEKHGVADKIKFVNEDFKIKQDYDFIVAMDVFEHLEKPQPVIEAVSKHTKYLFCNPREIKYNWLYPQHISQFSIEPYFKQIELYLFERRK